VTFRGWPVEAFDFFDELEGNNNRAWWLEHRDVYDRAIKAQFDALSALVTDEFGELHLFRPNRDVRFSKDKSPYKTAAAAMTEREGGSTYYVQISAEGLLAGSGMYHLARDQLQRFRDALADDRTGSQIATITSELEGSGYPVGAIEELKTAPRGWKADHPRIALARRKGLVVRRSFPRAKWQSTAKALDRIVDVWRAAEPMNSWLDAYVGPSEIPPEGWGS
jgi:uncharacterized protein (TIGR02453 family)